MSFEELLRKGRAMTGKGHAETIFAEAIEIASPQQREAYLERACRQDAALRQEVENLVANYFSAGTFLERPLAAISPPTLEHTIVEGPGTQIGPYKLLQQIGEGGFGVVFMAEQTVPVRRKVALKVIKPGMDTRQVIARFDAERQALAVMDHPHIARVLEAGATASGRPYFVMELVRGLPITTYCDEGNLPVRERLELFASVCQAIQHAHTKGIIHRDIKPTNVLVTRQDGQAVVKVIDFGIAKAMGQQLTDKTLFTEFAQMIGTPLYMSPEQAELSSLDIDTRSDIYSLGVLLYELLTGSTPVSVEQMKQAAFDEIRRIIREDEPQRPSLRISGSATLPAIAAHRHIEPARLSRLLRGELDWIVMRALEKDRGRRYETASGFAADVERYLNDEAVQACPPSAAYRFRKFARRNKAALVTASILFVALVVLVAGLGLSNVRVTAERNVKTQALKDRESALDAARQSAQQAEAESQRTRKNFLAARIAIREVITKAALGDGEWSQLPPLLRKKFSEEAITFYEGLLQAGSHPTDRYETAIAYRSIGLLHSRRGTGVHDLDQAEESYRKSAAILEELSREHPAEAEYRYQLTASQHGLASFLWNQRNHSPEAEGLLRHAIESLGKLLAGSPESFDYSGDLAKCLIEWQAVAGLDAVGDYQEFLDRVELIPSQRERIGHTTRVHAFQLEAAGRADEAERFLRQAVAIFERVTSETPASHKYWHYLADTHRRLGNLLTSRGRNDEAEQALRRAVGIHIQQLAQPLDWAGSWSEAAAAYSDLAQFLKSNGRHDEAEAVRRDAANGCLAAAGQYDRLAAESPATPEFRFTQAQIEFHAGQLLSQAARAGEAEQAYRRSVAVLQPIAQKFPEELKYRAELGRSLNWLALLLRSSGAMEQAEQQHRLAIGIYTELMELADPVDGHSHCRELAWSRMNLGSFLAAAQRPEEAEPEYRSAVALCEKLAAEQPADSQYGIWIGHALWSLSDVYLQSDRLDDAEHACTQALEAFQKLHAAAPANAFYMQEQGFTGRKLAHVSERAGRKEDAESHLRAALDWYGKLVAADPDSEFYRQEESVTRKHLADLMSRDERYPMAWLQRARVQADQRKWTETDASFDKAIELGKASTPEENYSLAEECAHLARVLREHQKLDQSERVFRHALFLREPVEESPPEIRLAQANDQNDLAFVLKAANQLQDAEEAVRRAVELKQQLVTEFPGTPDYKFHLAHSFLGLGYLLQDLTREPDAAEAFGKADQLLRDLADDSTATADFQQGVGHALWQLGDAWSRLQRSDEAEQAHRNALATFQHLEAGEPSESLTGVEQIARYRKLSGQMLSSGQLHGAGACYRLLLVLDGRMATEVRASADYRNELAGTLAYLGLALEKGRRAQAAEEAQAKALALWEKLSEEDPAHEWYRRERAYFSIHLAALLQSAGRTEDAVEHCRTSVRIHEQLTAEFADHPDYRPRLAHGRGMLISLLASVGRDEELAKEVETLLKAIPSAEELNGAAWALCSRSNPSAAAALRSVELAQRAVELNAGAGHIWNTLGMAQYRASNWQEAIAALEKSMELRMGGDSADWFILAMAHGQLNNKEDAAEWYHKAVEWMEKNQPQNEELRRFRAEAAELLGVQQGET